MAIPFRGDLTHDDVAEAIRLRHATDLPGSRRIIAILAALCFLAGVGTLPFSAIGDVRLSLAAFGLGALLVPLALVFPSLQRWMVVAEARHATVPEGTFSGEISGEGVTLRMPDGAGLRMQWRGLRNHLASDRLIVLVLPKDMVALLPRSFFADDAAWSEANELVRRRGGS